MLYKGLQLLYINQSFNQALVAYLQCSYIITDLVIDHFNSYIKHQRDTHPVDRWMNITTNQSFRAMMHWCIVSASTNTTDLQILLSKNTLERKDLRTAHPMACWNQTCQTRNWNCYLLHSQKQELGIWIDCKKHDCIWMERFVPTMSTIQIPLTSSDWRILDEF